LGGAGQPEVVRLVVGQGLKLAAIGVAAGLAAGARRVATSREAPV